MSCELSLLLRFINYNFQKNNICSLIGFTSYLICYIMCLTLYICQFCRSVMYEATFEVSLNRSLYGCTHMYMSAVAVCL